mmetsp:Transcript_28596/g.60109  ORF Transcript_28596/g.60109 Transcript_28596/m.60109 type:complete len:375 (-) Transcript_28596:450-1574(-)
MPAHSRNEPVIQQILRRSLGTVRNLDLFADVQSLSRFEKGALGRSPQRPDAPPGNFVRVEIAVIGEIQKGQETQRPIDEEGARSNERHGVAKSLGGETRSFFDPVVVVVVVGSVRASNAKGDGFGEGSSVRVPQRFFQPRRVVVDVVEEAVYFLRGAALQDFLFFFVPEEGVKLAHFSVGRQGGDVGVHERLDGRFATGQIGHSFGRGVAGRGVDVESGHFVEKEHGQETDVSGPSIVSLRQHVFVDDFGGQVRSQSQPAAVGVVEGNGGDGLIGFGDGFAGDQSESTELPWNVVVIVVVVVGGGDDRDASVERFENLRSVRRKRFVGNFGESFQSLGVVDGVVLGRITECGCGSRCRADASSPFGSPGGTNAR